MDQKELTRKTLEICEGVIDIFEDRICGRQWEKELRDVRVLALQLMKYIKDEETVDN